MISPCVTFNDHVGSTKSYVYTREHYHEVTEASLVPPAAEITTRQGEGRTEVPLHDGSTVKLRSVDADYDRAIAQAPSPTWRVSRPRARWPPASST